MTWWLYSLGLVVSAVSVFFVIRNYSLTRKLQRFDYAPRIQLSAESLVVGGAESEDRFSYSVSLENPGPKPVGINSIHVDFGSPEKPEDRMKRHVEGEFYLPSGGDRGIKVSLSDDEIQKVMARFRIDNCGFYLRVGVHDTNGRTVEQTRSLAQITPTGGVRFYVPCGDILI